MSYATDLQAVRDFLAHPDRWTRDADARDAEGHPVNAASCHAVAWCVGGAVIRVLPEYRQAAVIDLLNDAAAHYGFDSYVSFNDTEPHERVLRLIEAAIVLAEDVEDAEIEEAV